MPQSQNTDQLPAKSGRDTESQDQTFTDRSKAVLLLWILNVFVCRVFAMSFCASVYMCLVVTCWERADLLALVCGVQL